MHCTLKKNSPSNLTIGVWAHFFFWGGEGWAEIARMTLRHRFCDVIIKLYNLRRLQMKGFPLKIDKRDIKTNRSSLAISKERESYFLKKKEKVTNVRTLYLIYEIPSCIALDVQGI